MSYKIQRLYYRSNRRTTLHTRMTLEEAQAYCKDPETSSRTATSAAATSRTRRLGPWFDAYVPE